MLEMGLLLMNLAAPAEAVCIQTPYWRVEIADGAICSLRYDADGRESYGVELVFRPLTVEQEGTKIPLQPGHVSHASDGQALHINPAISGAQLRWVVDCSAEGYYDRLTASSPGTREPESPALLTFVSGGKGQCTVIEAFKRKQVERINSGELFIANHANPGNTTLIETADGCWFQVAHQPRQGARFRVEEDRLLLRFALADSGLTLQAYDARNGILLDGGERLPHFVFGTDEIVENTLGGRQPLTALFNAFYRQAAFWYPGGHGISAWAAWGGQGHAYMNSPYRIDSRNSLMHQIIACDGHGRDGYAWTWGDRLGWPFPEDYDTRHFGVNAMHIVGVQAQLGWSGEYDLVSGIDFSLFAYKDGEQVFGQAIAPTAYSMVRGRRYSQAFRLAEAADRIAVNLGAAPVDPYGQDHALLDRRFSPPNLDLSGKHLPQRVTDIPGSIAAQHFTALDAFNTVGVFTCAWHTPGNTLRLRAFRVQEDYVKTLAGEALAVARVPDVKDNGFSCLLFDREYPAGTEMLLVLDQPVSPDPGQISTAGFWHYPAPDGYPSLLLNGEALPGRCMRVLTGKRFFPEAQIRIEDAQGETVYDRVHSIAFPDGAPHGTFDVAAALAPGAYVVTLVSLGSALSWNGSHTVTGLGGEARYEGHSWHWLDRCRRAMGYQLDVLHAAREHALLLDGNQGDPDHSGVTGVTVGNNYYDILPFGYLDAYANAWFFDSLRAMAELERSWGTSEAAARYEAMREAVKARYNKLFWTDAGHQDGAARYIGCVDATGARHDYGFSFVNTLAATVGLADRTRAGAILDWLDQGRAYNPEGGQEDIYHFQFGPRTTTLDNPDWWAVNQRYESYPWGTQIQNGGANLYESYYDLQTRLFARGADDAYARFMAILRRYAEPDRLTGGSPLYTGDSIQGGDTAGAAGVMSYEFPETAMLAAIVVYGFLGANAGADGLRITPRLPQTQPFIRAEQLYYHGSYFDIEAHHDRIHISARPNEERCQYRIGDALLAPPFEYEGVYDDEGGVLVVPCP